MKKILLTICIFLLAGCDVTYNLTIGNSSVIESSNFYLENNKENSSIIDGYAASDYLAYYDMDSLKDNNYFLKKISDKNGIGINLKYNYKKNKYQYSSLLDMCYYKKSFDSNDDYVLFYTEGGARCFYQDGEEVLDSLTINIKTDLKGVENNADSVKGNVYTWKLNKDNFEDKDIYLKLKKKSGSNYVGIIVICIVIFIFILLYLLYLKMKNSKRNKL